MAGSEPQDIASAIVEHARDAIVVQSLDGAIVVWNRAAERMFGIVRANAVGSTLAHLLGEPAALSGEALRTVRDTGEWSGEFECTSASGRMITVQRHCTLLRNDAGEPHAVLATHTDVTEQRRAEKEIVLLSNVMEQRIRRRTAELEESNKDLREFAYSLAHDLRAPLASIDGFSAQLEIRLGDALDDRSRHYLRRVRAGVKLMSDLTDGLLGLADVANTELLHRRVDLSAVARTVLERLRETHPRREVNAVVNDTRAVRGDVRLLTDVLQNLLGNAWKFTSKTPAAHIEFGAEVQDDGAYAFFVKDNGAGFDPDYAHKLFGPFQRLHGAHEFEGTGIGLAMVRKIVMRHGGRVWARSRPGEGATFYFTLNEEAARPRS
jgi:PAS domain S-box-containing protein